MTCWLQVLCALAFLHRKLLVGSIGLSVVGEMSCPPAQHRSAPGWAAGAALGWFHTSRVGVGQTSPTGCRA